MTDQTASRPRPATGYQGAGATPAVGPDATRMAVLDLGSNSFHVLVADITPDGAIVPILRQREMRHLGAISARNNGTIPDDAVAESIETVTWLADLAWRSGAQDLLGAATAALRDATNGPGIVAALSEAAGTDIKVLTGHDEAEGAYLGARSGMALPDGPVLVLDLGGGSLEFAIGSGAKPEWSASTQLGVGRVGAELVQNDPLTDADVTRIREAVFAQLDPHVADIKGHEHLRTVTVGGTIRALARLIIAERGGWVPVSVNQLGLDRRQIHDWAERLRGMTLEERTNLPGMKQRRADHVHIAAVIIDAVLERLDENEILISDWGLREGWLLQASGIDTIPDADTLRHRETTRLQETFLGPDPHSEHVRHLALRLFAELDGFHRLGIGEQDLLEHAAKVHAIGSAIALRRHPHHAAYLVEHAELRGFAPIEIAALVTLVRFHESLGINHRFPPYAWLNELEQARLQRILPMLQLASTLDRTGDQSVTDVKASFVDRTAHVQLIGEDLRVVMPELTRRIARLKKDLDIDGDITIAD